MSFTTIFLFLTWGYVYWFERERKGERVREREREREKHQSVAYRMHPNWKLNPQLFGAWDGAPTS